jgi:NAD(P)-dependent dehydrogenase (short-subunit alcohol dehydrogenase family)
MTGLLSGRRVVLTGCARNIGAATAERFAREGARLVLCDIDPAVEETAAGIRSQGGEATAVVADVADDDAVGRMAADAAQRLDGIDILVNNAAIHRVGSITDFRLDDWDATFAVNVRSCFLTTRALVPHMRTAGGGAIVNTSSQTGLHGAPGASAYSASKGAIIALTKALALELAGDGIRVNAICPGWVDTSFNTPAIAMLGGSDAHAELVRASIPLGRQARPDEIAWGTLFLASDASSYMTGQVLPIDGGVT